MAANSASVGSAAVGLPPMTAITKIAAAEKILILTTAVGCLGRLARKEKIVRMDTDIPADCNTARVTRQSDTFAWSCGCHSVTVGVEICAYLLDGTVDGVKWWYVCLFRN